MSRALGRRPGDPTKPALKLGDFLKVVPDHPLSVDDMQEVTFGLDHNDVFGTCVPTSVDNLRRAVTKLLTGKQTDTSWTEVVRWYRSQNPGFDPNRSWNDPAQEDNGMVIQDLLAWLTKEKIILGFAKLDVRDDDELQAAMYLGLGIIWGVDLQTAQQAQTDAGLWDYSPSGEWGGHAVLAAAYESNDQQDVITWAERVRTSDAFRRHQLDEAWMVILPEHVQHPDFRAGFDLPKFAAAYTAITGRPFPANVTPPQPPTGGGVSFPGSSAEVDARIVAAATRAGLTIPKWMERHFRSYFKMPSASAGGKAGIMDTELLTTWWSRAKAIVAVLIPVAQLIDAAVSDGDITGDEWQKIAIAVVGAIFVYFVPNKGYINRGGSSWAARSDDAPRV